LMGECTLMRIRTAALFIFCKGGKITSIQAWHL
jgi:hypothetical protein